MSTTYANEPLTRTESETPSKALEEYYSGPIHLAGTENGLYERHLLFDNVIDKASADARDRFEAFARSTRDILSQPFQHSGIRSLEFT